MSFPDRCAPLFLFLVAAALLTSGCNSRGPNAQFYYPIDDLADGLVYAYESTDSPPLAPYAWYFRSVVTPDSIVLASTRYDVDYEPRQFVNERIVQQGALLRDLRLFTPTDTTSLEVQAEVLASALFSFEDPRPDRVLVNQVRFALPRPPEAHVDSTLLDSSFRQNLPQSDTYTLTRNRSYLRDTVVMWQGEARAAQVWSVRELTEQERDGVLALETESREVYAEGIGLVLVERRFGNGNAEHYRLAERFVMDTLVARAQRY